MVSHFSTIGLPINSNEEFMAYARLVHESGERIKAGENAYLKLELGEGVELWGQVNEANEMIGLNPHFKGMAVSTVRLTEKVENPAATVLDGQVYSEADPGDPEEFAYPFVFDLPDMSLHELHFPVIKEVQLAAFAHELNIYANENVYKQVQENEGGNFATEFFIPSGLFSEEESESLPESTAIFGGRVQTVKKIRNPHTGESFYYAEVKTLGGVFDVVVDPELVTEEITEDSIISGSFWLTGRIVNE
ncbi:hypothetical protein IGI39_004580 [Enterococcus sp. AZ135]|uniref:hypothetical protein n=1 Tax=unclassified Enterococcus TaxID=2608891 RepID=UPI003F2632E7